MASRTIRPMMPEQKKLKILLQSCCTNCLHRCLQQGEAVGHPQFRRAAGAWWFHSAGLTTFSLTKSSREGWEEVYIQGGKWKWTLKDKN